MGCCSLLWTSYLNSALDPVCLSVRIVLLLLLLTFHSPQPPRAHSPVTSWCICIRCVHVFTHVCAAAPHRWPWKSAWMSVWRPWISSLTTTSTRAWRGCGQGNGIIHRGFNQLLLECHVVVRCMLCFSTFIVVCFSMMSAVFGRGQC